MEIVGFPMGRLISLYCDICMHVFMLLCLSMCFVFIHFNHVHVLERKINKSCNYFTVFQNNGDYGDMRLKIWVIS